MASSNTDPRSAFLHNLPPSSISPSTATQAESARSRKAAGPALSRNQACRTCRNRKVRCDAVKPGCGACRKSATVQNRDPDAVICDYDDEIPSTNNSNKRRKSSGEAANKKSRTLSSSATSGNEGSSSDAGAGRPIQRSVSDLQRQITQLENNIHNRGIANNGGGGSGSAFRASPVQAGSGLAAESPGIPVGDWVSNAAGADSLLPGHYNLFQNNASGPSGNFFALPPVKDYRMPDHLASSQHIFNASSDGTVPAGTTVSSLFAASGDAVSQPDYVPSRRSSGGLNSPSGIAAPTTPDLIGGSSGNLNGLDGQAHNGASSGFATGGDGEASATAYTAMPESMPDPDFFSLFWPNWPPSLPSPKLVYSLCDVYFSKKFMFSELVNKAKFYGNLALPPSHRDFPHVALVHAICAVATKFVGQDAYGLNTENYWRSEPSPTDYHAAMAKQHIDSAMVKGEKLFSVAQAIILICFYSYTSARFVEVWLYCGLATRICSPLGLNHLEELIDAISSGVSETISKDAFFRKPDHKTGGKSNLQTEEEKREHAHVFWLAFTADRLASACTGWAQSLAEDEASTLLPKPADTTGPIQQITAQELEQLSLSSPTFFTANSLPLVDATNLMYKSVVLLGRVCSFLRRAAWPVGQDIIRTARFVAMGGKPRVSDIVNSPDFKRLDALIVAFRLSFPKEYKNVLRKDHNGVVETDLIASHVISHCCSCLLHEVFVEQADDLPMQRCLTSARSILSIIYLLWGSSEEILHLQPFVTFVFAVAGRTLVRQLAFLREVDSELDAATVTQEINVIISALAGCADRMPLAGVVATSLRTLFADPDSCHPRRNGGLAMSKISGESMCMSAQTPTNAGSGSSSRLTEMDTPTFSGLLFELEQPGGMALGENESYKTMEMDLRDVLGPSYDQLLNA